MWYTDDPVADAERRMRIQQAEVDKLPRCSECDEPIQTEFCYEVNDELLCPDCMDDNHRKRVEDYAQ